MVILPYFISIICSNGREVSLDIRLVWHKLILCSLGKIIGQLHSN